jgi:hypothetical protein
MLDELNGGFMEVNEIEKVDEDRGSAANAAVGEEAMNYGDLLKLIIKKSTNNIEYKKYGEYANMLVLGYYKRLGSVDKAYEVVYSLVENAANVQELAKHYNALKKDEKGSNAEAPAERAKERISNTLFNDYKRRFGEKKAEAYKVLVLQGWIGKVESVNEMAILMDNILTIRDRLGNSWDYEVHMIPLLIEKAFNAETLIDFSNSMTNLVIGLSRKLKDNYLAVMTAMKVLEFADSPKVIKLYIRDMIKDASKELDRINAEMAAISSSSFTKVTQIVRLKELDMRAAGITKQIDELMSGIDPKELMLENTKR